MAEETLFTRAVVFAARAHDSQRRKGSGVPYIVHPVEAAAIVATLTDDPEVRAAAVLHDVLEDCGVARQALEAAFGPRVAALVAAESETKEADAAGSWVRRKTAALKHMADAPRDEKMIALGDKLSNLRALARDQAALGDALWTRFNQKDRDMHAWYYRGMLRAMDELADTPPWREAEALARAIFGPQAQKKEEEET